MRTQDEIVDRMRALAASGQDLFGFAQEAMLSALDFEHAKPWLKDGVTAEQWSPDTSAAGVLRELAEYMAFAWEKALGHRGLSADRSVTKLTQWLWVLGSHDELVSSVEAGRVPYAQYGAPVLKAISDAVGLPTPDSADAVNMMAGRPCTPGCDSGCGS